MDFEKKTLPLQRQQCRRYVYTASVIRGETLRLASDLPAMPLETITRIQLTYTIICPTFWVHISSLHVGLKKSYAYRRTLAPGGGRAAFRWRSTLARPYRLVRQAFVGTRQSGRKAASARPRIGVGSPPGHLRLCQNNGVTLRVRNHTNRSKSCKPCVLKTEEQKSSQEHKLTFCVFIMRQKHGANG